MSYSDVKTFLLFPKVIITNYFQSKLKDEKWRHKSDIDNFLKGVADCSIEHIIPIEPSYIDIFSFGADQDHIFSYTFEDPMADYMDKECTGASTRLNPRSNFRPHILVNHANVMVNCGS